MEIIVGAMVIAAIISSAIHNAKLDHAYAKQGMVSPRLEARYGGAAAARAKVAQYGFFDFLRDAWRDGWSRRTDALIAARNARDAKGRPVSWRDRFRAARTTIATAPAVAAAAPAPGRTTPTDPGPDPDPAPATPPADPPDPAAPTSPADPAPPGDPGPPQPGPPVTNDPAAPAAGQSTPVPEGPTDPVPPDGTADTNTAPGGTPVTNPNGGEVSNFETALAELDARIKAHADQIEAADQALAALAEAKAAIETLQDSYEPSAESAANAADSKDAMNLDSTTMGHAGAAVDALPVGAVNNLYEQIEETEQLTQERHNQAQVALEAAQAEREHLIATYADAHDTVASNLGGNSEFLDSSAAPAPQPVGASQ